MSAALMHVLPKIRSLIERYQHELQTFTVGSSDTEVCQAFFRMSQVLSPTILLDMVDTLIRVEELTKLYRPLAERAAHDHEGDEYQLGVAQGIRTCLYDLQAILTGAGDDPPESAQPQAEPEAKKD